METEKRFVELVAFVREQIREFDLPVTKETLIEDDLGVTGDEANELIIAFGKRYNVDISNFWFEKYFYDEPNVFKSQGRVIVPFTIGYLEKAIIAGRLDEAVINS